MYMYSQYTITLTVQIYKGNFASQFAENRPRKMLIHILFFFFILTTLLGLTCTCIAPKGLDTNGILGPMLGVHPLQLTDHNTGISLLLSTSVWVLLSPSIACQETRPTA